MKQLVSLVKTEYYKETTYENYFLLALIAKISVEKEIEILKSEMSKSKQVETSGEILRVVEKYEKEKDLLTEHNQVFDNQKLKSFYVKFHFKFFIFSH